MNKVSFYGSAAIVMAAVFTVSTYAQEWEMPRTEFGDPDLQGIWSNATQTRLERDAALGEQQAFTDEEALARESRSRDRQIEADRASDPDRSPPTDGNTAAGYNSFWLDRGNSIVQINGEYRTSMIIDPPDGKIPLLPVAERSATQLQRWLQQPLVEPFDGPELQTIGERCLLFWDFRTSNSSAGPPMMPVIYNNNYQIVQTQDYVVIMAEMIHDARIIRLRDEHHSDGDESVDGGFGWILGRRHPSCGDAKPPSAAKPLRFQSRPCGHRAFYPQQRRADRLSIHDGRSRSLQSALDR